MLIRKKIKDKVTVAYPMVDKIVLYMDSQLHWLSDYLQQQTNGLSIKTKRISFFFFCLFFTMLSLIVLLNGFSRNRRPVVIPSITAPVYVGKPSNDLRRNANIISKTELEHLQAFQQYLDSLKTTNTGRLLLDSIVNARPHLMDSIPLLERIYQIQSLKK